MYQINIHMSCRSHMYILHTLCRIIVYCPSRAKMIIHNSASGRGEESNWKDYHLVWGWAHNGWLNSQQVNRTVSVQLDDQAVHARGRGRELLFEYSTERTTASHCVVLRGVGHERPTHKDTNSHSDPGPRSCYGGGSGTRDKRTHMRLLNAPIDIVNHAGFRPVGTTGTMSKKIDWCTEFEFWYRVYLLVVYDNTCTTGTAK